MRRITLALLAGSLVVGLLAAPVQARRPGPNLVETAMAVNASGPYAGSFDTLIAAVVDAGLVSALSGNRQLTVFAPTDDAFAALGLNAANIGSVPDDTLRNILLYHVAGTRRACWTRRRSRRCRAAAWPSPSGVARPT